LSCAHRIASSKPQSIDDTIADSAAADGADGSTRRSAIPSPTASAARFAASVAGSTALPWAASRLRVAIATSSAVAASFVHRSATSSTRTASSAPSTMRAQPIAARTSAL
jgi:hypothetical protein